MKRSLLAALLLLSFSFPVSSQNKQAADALNEGVRLYKSGKFAEARAQFEKSLAIDPSQ